MSDFLLLASDHRSMSNPTQLKRCPYGQECLSMSELSWICNPAPLNIRIYNPKYTVLTFLPHHRCSYSMVSDCKSDTTDTTANFCFFCYLVSPTFLTLGNSNEFDCSRLIGKFCGTRKTPSLRDMKNTLSA